MQKQKQKQVLELLNLVYRSLTQQQQPAAQTTNALHARLAEGMVATAVVAVSTTKLNATSAQLIREASTLEKRQETCILEAKNTPAGIEVEVPNPS